MLTRCSRRSDEYNLEELKCRSDESSRLLWVEFVVGSRPSVRDFSPGSPVFLPPHWDWESEDHRFVSARLIMCNIC